MTATAYFQGQYVPEDQANVNIKTHAFLYGTSIFEGIRGYWNDETETVYLMRAREHYARMVENSKFLLMDMAWTVDDLMAITSELVARNGLPQDVYIQPRFYKSGLVVPPRLEEVETDLCCFVMPFGSYVDTEKGLKACVSSWRRVSDNAITPRGKIGGAYVNSGLVMAEAHLNGFDDGIVLTEEGNVSEGSGMNVFLVKNNTLITPRTTDNILEGITRASVMELAEKELKIPAVARPVNRTELYTADEIFFCGTAAQIAPVVSVDHRKVGSGSVGPVSRQIRDLYNQAVRGKLLQYQHWLTPVKLHAHSHS